MVLIKFCVFFPETFQYFATSPSPAAMGWMPLVVQKMASQ